MVMENMTGCCVTYLMARYKNAEWEERGNARKALSKESEIDRVELMFSQEHAAR